MPAALDRIAPTLADLQAVVEHVWSSYLGEEELLLVGPATAGHAYAWSAAVSIAGGWHGTVTVELAGPVAAELTRLMLDLPEDGGRAGDLVDADVADAVGELVNMIGGNVKSLLPGPSALTLPAVAAGRAAHSSQSAEVACLDALWRGAPVRISVRMPA